MRYFDHNATTPVREEILANLPEWLSLYGNASSVHAVGRKANAALEDARARVLAATGLAGMRAIFTSGGTESNRLALNEYVMRGPEAGRNRILLSAVEHPCIRKQSGMLRKAGFEVLEIPVTQDGVVHMGWLAENVGDNVACVSVMLANNETGAIQPVEDLSTRCAEHGIHFHCDAVQGPGKMLIDWSTIGADSISLTAHKFYGLKGTGVLLSRRKPEPLFFGGSQESGLRAGTENIPGALAFATAFELSLQESPTLIPRLLALQKRLETDLLRRIPGARIVSAGAPRLANTSCVLLPGIENDVLVMQLDRAGFAVSSGAACHSGAWEPSQVLLAQGLSFEEARTAVRISTGRLTSAEDVEELLHSISAALRLCAKFPLRTSRQRR